MTTTANGKMMFSGKAARNCARGWTRSATRGLGPFQTPIGTQTMVASVMSTMTRRVLSPMTFATSTQVSSVATKLAISQSA